MSREIKEVKNYTQYLSHMIKNIVYDCKSKKLHHEKALVAHRKL